MPRKSNHIPFRRCIGCMVSKPQEELIRIAYGNGAPLVDRDGTFPGRGAYICGSEDCIETAIKRRAFQRVLRTALNDEELNKLIDEIKEIGCKKKD